MDNKDDSPRTLITIDGKVVGSIKRLTPTLTTRVLWAKDVFDITPSQPAEFPVELSVVVEGKISFIGPGLVDFLEPEPLRDLVERLGIEPTPEMQLVLDQPYWLVQRNEVLE